MEDTDLVQMFESHIATGLNNFLGCPAVFNEDALTGIFANSSVTKDGLVVSTVNGVSVEISEEVFAATFELPVEGLTDLSDVPKNLVFDARSFFSISKEQPWTATASQIIDLLSAAHSKSLEVLLIQQKEHGLPIEKSCTSTCLDTSIGSGAVLAQFFSQAKSKCWEQLYCLESPESPPPIPQQQESSSSSSDSQMNFDTTDIPLDDTAEAQTSLLAATVDLSPLLDDLKTSLSQCVDTAHSDILSRLRTIEQGLHNTLGFQNDYFRNLIQGARQEGKNNDDLQILRLNELKKNVMTQGVTVDTASLEIRKAINAASHFDPFADSLGVIRRRDWVRPRCIESTRSVLGKCVYLVTLAMSLFDLQDVCIAIGSTATLDLPMVVDLIGIYGLKGPYCTLTTTNWFLQALSVIPRRSWGDVARRSYHDPLGKFGIVIPEPQWLWAHG
ncbi:hypothetical protein F511_43448 [Dorcoceras hygrometricum]|uniref:Uncharacterized protein n=1 Tax=Dorcoceras hygrometricum TaxID=472368 RepID=A0A2Z7CZ57_9LAMI|nr:hypothetical protein F511_43448 [Dorcoceras hygrometricum]